MKKNSGILNCEKKLFTVLLGIPNPKTSICENTTSIMVNPRNASTHSILLVGFRVVEMFFDKKSFMILVL